MKFTVEQSVVAHLFTSRQRPIIRHTITAEEKEFDFYEWKKLIKNRDKVDDATAKVRKQLENGTSKPDPELDAWTWEGAWTAI